eukprot:403352282
MEITVQEECGKQHLYTSFQETTTVFDIKQNIQKDTGYSIDQQIFKLGNNLLPDTLAIKQIPSDESFRSPEIAVSQADKKRIITLKLCKRKFQLSLHIQDSKNMSHELQLELFASCTVFTLKHMIYEKAKIKVCEQIISNKKEVLSDDKFLFSYLALTPFQEEEQKQGGSGFDNFNSAIIEEELMDLKNTNIADQENQLTIKHRLSLVLKKVNPINKRISVGLDFTFNSLRNVKRVNWQPDAPWFRETQDGLNWICYCKNSKCAAHHQLVIVPRGFSLFKLNKEVKDHLTCLVCKTKELDLRNVGFVNCEWVLKGKLMNKDDSRVFAEGKTYDGKLYTFKETNYVKAFENLEVMVKRIKEVMIVNDSQIYTDSVRSSQASESIDHIKDPTLEKLQQQKNAIEQGTKQQINLENCKTQNDNQSIAEDIIKGPQAKKHRTTITQNQKQIMNKNWRDFAKCNSCCNEDTSNLNIEAQNLDKRPISKNLSNSLKSGIHKSNSLNSQINQQEVQKSKCLIF